MTTPCLRKFGILDAIILVVATAAGFGVIRARESVFAAATVFSARSGIVERGTAATIPFLMAWTLAFLVLRLRRPRPRLRRLARQPGMAACVAAMPAMAYASVWTPLIAIKFGAIQRAWQKGFLPDARSFFFSTYGDLVAFWVVGAWLTLALGCRWRSEPNWIDRLGTILGLAWIMVKAAPYVATFLPR